MQQLPSLQDFEPPPFDNLLTTSYIHGQVTHCTKEQLTQECQPFAPYLKDLPNIALTQDVLAARESTRTITSRDLFLPVQDSPLKRIVNVWREKGIVQALRVAANEDPTQINPCLRWFANKFTQFWNVIERGTFTYDGLPLSGIGSVADVAATRDWNTSLVRCLAWHPHCTRLAVATRDDRIRIYADNGGSIAVLRHSAQKLVSSMQWRPYTGRELAAACEYGALVWTVELGAASNSLSHAVLLEYRNHAPVTSVSWHPQGDYLVTCSLRDTNMIIWDVECEEGIPLKRVGGGNLCFTRWSPCGSKLFASTCSTVFRIWDIGIGDPWEAEKWHVPGGRVAAACFGDQLTLLFTSTEESGMIFSLPLQEQIFKEKKKTIFGDEKTAVPVMDLSRVTFPSLDDESEILLGGRVISMECDPTGNYIAILFEESFIVALFRIKVGAISKVNEIQPLCLIRGFVGDKPNFIHFYQNHRDLSDVAYLTITWNSGLIQHFPIVENIQLRAENCPKFSNTSYSNNFNITEDYTFNLSQVPPSFHTLGSDFT